MDKELCGAVHIICQKKIGSNRIGRNNFLMNEGQRGKNCRNQFPYPFVSSFLPSPMRE